MMRRWISGLLLLLGCLLVLLGLAYGAVWSYILWREASSPSTRSVLVLSDGQQVPLIQPTPSRQAPPPMAGSDDHDRGATGAVDVPPQRAAILPPERILIPEIGVDWPVVLGNNDNLPRFKGVGWFMGSGFPGQPGNMVLFGHLGGPYGTFMRLNELQPGDQFSVTTRYSEYHYRVTAIFETTPDDVAQMLPGDAATATLITCSGPWDPVRQTNERRLIVKADLVQETARGPVR